MMICPASVPVSVELCPAQSRATPKRIGASGPRNVGRSSCASRSLATSCAVAVEDRRAQHEDRRVDEEGDVERDRRVDQVVAARLRLARVRRCRSAATGPGPSAGRGCAASPSPRGCRWRRTSAPGGRLGRKPETIPPNSGRARTIWSRKQAPIVATRARITASIFRIPHFWSQSSRKVSNAVTRQPQSSGMPKSSFSAMIVPSDLGQVARRDRDLGQEPEHDVDRLRILGPARLRQVVPRDHARASPRGSGAARPSGSTSAGPRSAHSRTWPRPRGPSPSCPGPCSRR